MKRLGLGIIVAMLAIGPAAAAELPKEGTFDLTNCWQGTGTSVQLNKDNGFSYELVGSSVSNPPGGMFDKVSFRCVGLVTNIKGKFSQYQFCEGLDQSGDRFSYETTTEAPGKVATSSVDGTGKYEGMIRTSHLESYAVPTMKPGTFQRCGHTTGTYKLK